MSIYIKGMEMPEMCDMCPLLAFIEEDEDHDAFCYCTLSNWKKSCTPDPMTIHEVRKFRRLDCPLVEVPPHGRLIDADALKPKFIHGRWDDTYVSSLDLLHVPTIIPAEED